MEDASFWTNAAYGVREAMMLIPTIKLPEV